MLTLARFAERPTTEPAVVRRWVVNADKSPGAYRVVSISLEVEVKHHDVGDKPTWYRDAGAGFYTLGVGGRWRFGRDICTFIGTYQALCFGPFFFAWFKPRATA